MLVVMVMLAMVVLGMGNTEVMAGSTYPFLINVTSPLGGARCVIGKTYEINWVFNLGAPPAEQIDYVSVILNVGGVNYYLGKASLNGPYSWTIPSQINGVSLVDVTCSITVITHVVPGGYYASWWGYSDKFTIISIYPSWDINQDGVCNMIDLMLVKIHMATHNDGYTFTYIDEETGEVVVVTVPPSPDWNPACDVIQDGVVNMLDYQIVKKHVGQLSPIIGYE
jgi:hypothetical protein